MPIIKSAKKRVRTARKATIRNAKTKKVVKTAVKSFRTKVTAAGLSEAQRALDIAVKKGILSKNKAARKKRALAAQAKTAGIKLSTGKKSTPTVKAPAKKRAAKKTSAKK